MSLDINCLWTRLCMSYRNGTHWVIFLSSKLNTALQTVHHCLNIYAGSCVALVLWREDEHRKLVTRFGIIRHNTLRYNERHGLKIMLLLDIWSFEKKYSKTCRFNDLMQLFITKLNIKTITLKCNNRPLVWWQI